jgi:hypothetical protein
MAPARGAEGGTLRFVCIATASFRTQVERLLFSLNRVHPDAPVTLYTDETQAFQGLPHDRVQVEQLDSIMTLGIKRAKFDMYARAINDGPFVYLDADIIVLRPLDRLLGDHLTACHDDLNGCPFIQDRTHPWPGEPQLVNSRYINSGVLGFGPDTASWINDLRDRALDDDVWERQIHPDGLFDNHVLCAYLNLNDVPLDYVSEYSYNWQGLRDSRGGLRLTLHEDGLRSDETGEPVHLVHFAGVDDIDRYVLGLPLEVAAFLNAASLQPVDPARAACSVMAGRGTSIADVTDRHRGTTASVMTRAFIDSWSSGEVWADAAYVSDPDAVTSVALATPSRPWQRWNGLVCGGAYLEPEEYAALRDIVERSDAQRIVEFGAGETTQLFASLAADVTAFEATHGPWFERAASSRATVCLAPLDEDGRMPVDRLREALTDGVDLLFVDSPNGTLARRRVLAQALEFTVPHRIVMHDARRDVASLLDVVAPFGYVVEASILSHRGLVVLRAPSLPAMTAATPAQYSPLTDHRASFEAAGFTSTGDPVMQVTNTSAESWPVHGEMPVHASYHVMLDGHAAIFDGARTPLPCSLRPGDTLAMPVAVPREHRLGGAEVRVTLVQEGVAWFDQVAHEQFLPCLLPTLSG